MNPTISYLNPHHIKTPPNRQRSEINIDDILPSIREIGIITPIIIKDLTNDGDATLVAGERRLEACKKLNLSSIPCILFSDLSPIESKRIEFEENAKRNPLPWRDHVTAVGELHKLYLEDNPSWSKPQTSKELSINEPTLYTILNIYDNLDNPILKFAENINQAQNLLKRFKQEKTQKLSNQITQTLSSKPIPQHLIIKPKQPQVLDLDFETNETKDPSPQGLQPPNTKQIFPILNINFLDWIQEYQGPKFNLIHLDFPQKDEEFWPLFNTFFQNLDKVLDNNARILLWFRMLYYYEIISEIGSYNYNLKPVPQPLIWYKSNLKSNELTNSPPRSSYETCFIFEHGSPKYLKQIENHYSSPRTSQPICPNQKSLPMLKYFFQTFINQETNLLDPTCGSGSSLLAAEELGARSVLGLELNKDLCQKANEKILKSRELRSLMRK